MPFTETDIVDERTRFIEDAHRSLHSFTWLCQHYAEPVNDNGTLYGIN